MDPSVSRNSEEEERRDASSLVQSEPDVGAVDAPRDSPQAQEHPHAMPQLQPSPGQERRVVFILDAMGEMREVDGPEVAGTNGVASPTATFNSCATPYLPWPPSTDTVSVATQPTSEMGDGCSSGSALPAPIPTLRTKRAKQGQGQLALGKGVVVQGMTWLKIDRFGTTTLVTTDKHRVAIKLGVQPRDLRLLDSQLASVSPPAILDRERAIVVNIGSIKCIITLEYVLVVNPDDEVGAQLAAVLKDKLSNPRHVGKVMSYPGMTRINSIARTDSNASSRTVVFELSFELKVLEICLDMVIDALEVDAGELERLIIPTLDGLTKKIKHQALEVMRRGKNRLTRLVKRIETIKEVLEKFLEDDEDMHKLNLTAQEATRLATVYGPKEAPSPMSRTPRATRSKRGSRASGGSGVASSSSSSSSSSSGSSSGDWEDEAEVAEVEMLLEAYQMHLDHLFNKLQTLEQFVQDTEDLVNVALDTHRNRIISVDIVLTAFATSLALSTSVSGLFGVNMEFHVWVPNTLRSFQLIVGIAVVGLPLLMLAAFIAWVYQQRLLR